jgi:hypothetical protein
MFARVCELHIKPEKKQEIISAERDVILPMLEQYDGFLDLIPLELDTHPRKFFRDLAAARRARRGEICDGMLPEDL